MFCPEGSAGLPSSNHWTCLCGEEEGPMVMVTHGGCKEGTRTGITNRQGGTPFVYQGVFPHWPGMRFSGDIHCNCPQGPSTWRESKVEVGG